MARRRNPESDGDYYYVRDDVDHALTTCGYCLIGKDRHGLSYAYKGNRVFFFSYYKRSAQRKQLPEIHITPSSPGRPRAAREEMETVYRQYLHQIGKGRFARNVKHATNNLEIKQPPAKEFEPEEMSWDDIKEIVLNLHRVHHDAPTCA